MDSKNMESKSDIEQYEQKSGEENVVQIELPQRPSKWSYFAAVGVILGWIAQIQLFSQSGLLLNIINVDLGAKKQFPWVFESFLFGAAILSPTAGALGDRFGRRWFLVLGNLISVVGGIICATAQSVNVVIVGMAIAGVGTTGQHFAVAGISELFPRKDRGYAQGALQFAAFPFTACGVIMAASMATHSTWRWTYYSYILISSLALVTTFLFYDPPVPEKSISTSKYLQTLDWAQPGLVILAITSLAIGAGFAIFGIYSWRHTAVLLPIFVGFAIFGVWVIRVRTYHGPNPLFPKEIFTRKMLILLLITALTSFSVYSASFTWTSEAQSLYTTDLIKLGRYNFPVGFGTEVGVLLSALTVRKLGRTHLQLTATCFFLTLFVALMATLTPNSVRPAFAYLSLAGVASGFLQVLLPVMIQFTNPDERIGSVTGFLILFRYVGGAAGILMSLSILRSRVGSTWVPNVAKVTLPLGLPETSLPLLLGALQTGDVSMIMQVPGISLAIIGAATEATKTTYANAFRITYYPILALGVVGTILAFFFSPDVTSLMDNSLAVPHYKPWFLGFKRQNTPKEETAGVTTGGTLEG